MCAVYCIRPAVNLTLLTFVCYYLCVCGAVMPEDQKEVLSAAVAVKPPPFDETSVSRWFSIIESQFVLAGITRSATKFHHILANLPVRVINQLSDSVVSSADYDQLQKSLVSLFARSKPELFDTLVSQNQIVMQKPTVYLQHLRKIASQLDVNDDFLRIKFLKALPSSIRPMLVTYDPATSLEELARVADTLLAYNSDHVQSNVLNVSEDPCSKCSNYNVNHVQQARSTRNRGPGIVSVTGSRSNAPDFSHSSLPMGVRAFHMNQRPRVCRYHIYYGSNAKSCKRWCILSSSSLNILPDSRPSSRSASPSSNHREVSEN